MTLSIAVPTSQITPPVLPHVPTLGDEERQFFMERQGWYNGTPVPQLLGHMASQFNLAYKADLTVEDVRVLLSQAREAARNESANAVHKKPRRNGHHKDLNEKPRCIKRRRCG